MRIWYNGSCHYNGVAARMEPLNHDGPLYFLEEESWYNSSCNYNGVAARMEPLNHKGGSEMLSRYVEQIFSIYNHIDTIILTDAKGYVEYYMTWRPDVNPNKPENVMGKHVLDAWRSLTEETSTIMRVLKTGSPVLNEYQTFPYDDITMPSINTTMPIVEKGQLVGTATMIRYLQEPFKRNEIVLDIKKKEGFSTRYSLDDIKGCSESTEYLKDRIRMVANTDSSVLIYGETGVGKDLVAQSLHALSARCNKRFVSQNCAAIPENLLESILFGTVKGAYTGAENRQGLFEIAKGGTLFLDEINSMDIGVQAKILKAIEEKEITRIGGTTPISTDIRIISAINEEPMECIKSKKLRRDLFYRLSVVEIDIEPLRKRREDIEYLTNYFINQNNKNMNRAIIGIDDDVKTLFEKYDWPGNVRELKNVLEGAFNVATSRNIKKEYLPGYMLSSDEISPSAIARKRIAYSNNDDPFSLDDAVKEYERKLIISAVENSKSLSEAAKKLGISRQNLNYKLKRHGFIY